MKTSGKVLSGVLVAATIAGLVIGIVMYINAHKNDNKDGTDPNPADRGGDDGRGNGTPPVNPGGNNTPPAPPPPPKQTTINWNKNLYKGIVSPEVGMLQAQLGVKQDNDFGKITDAALFAKTGKHTMSLNLYWMKYLNMAPHYPLDGGNEMKLLDQAGWWYKISHPY